MLAFASDLEELRNQSSSSGGGDKGGGGVLPGVSEDVLVSRRITALADSVNVLVNSSLLCDGLDETDEGGATSSSSSNAALANELWMAGWDDATSKQVLKSFNEATAAAAAEQVDDEDEDGDVSQRGAAVRAVERDDGDAGSENDHDDDDAGEDPENDDDAQHDGRDSGKDDDDDDGNGGSEMEE